MDKGGLGGVDSHPQIPCQSMKQRVRLNQEPGILTQGLSQQKTVLSVPGGVSDLVLGFLRQYRATLL